MKLFKQHNAKEESPKWSGYYNTDKGLLYFSYPTECWFTRSDGESDEYPSFWYSEQPAEVEGKGVDWSKIKEDFFSEYGDDIDRPGAVIMLTTKNLTDIVEWFQEHAEFSPQGEAVTFEWIDVKGELPRINKSVLSVTNTGRMIITWVDQGMKALDPECINEDEYFTHYAYLPAPPKSIRKPTK